MSSVRLARDGYRPVPPDSSCRAGHPKYRHAPCQECLAGARPRRHPKARHLLAVKQHGFHALAVA